MGICSSKQHDKSNNDNNVDNSNDVVSKMDNMNDDNDDEYYKYKDVDRVGLIRDYHTYGVYSNKIVGDYSTDYFNHNETNYTSLEYIHKLMKDKQLQKKVLLYDARGIRVFRLTHDFYDSPSTKVCKMGDISDDIRGVKLLHDHGLERDTEVVKCSNGSVIVSPFKLMKDFKVKFDSYFATLIRSVVEYREKGVQHCDLAPRNIALDGSLIDFGCVHAIGSEWELERIPNFIRRLNVDFTVSELYDKHSIMCLILSCCGVNVSKSFTGSGGFVGWHMVDGCYELQKELVRNNNIDDIPPVLMGQEFDYSVVEQNQHILESALAHYDTFLSEWDLDGVRCERISDEEQTGWITIGPNVKLRLMKWLHFYHYFSRGFFYEDVDAIMFTHGFVQLVREGIVSDERFRRLTVLNLSLSSLNEAFSSLDEADYNFIIEKCQNVKRVNASGSKITDCTVVVIAHKFPELEELDVNSCSLLTDASIIAIANNCHQLKSLIAQECNQLTDASIIAIANNCPQLKSLNVYGCNQLTDESIIAIANNCPQLKSLNVYGCNQLTDANLELVKRNGTNVYK